MSKKQPTSSSSIDRRDLLKLSLLGAASFAIHGCKAMPGNFLKKPTPNEKLRIAMIGCGGMGGADLESLLGENIVAACDVDWETGAEGFTRVPNAKKFWDYREMLETLTDIDAVVVSTPDHTHAPAAAMALRMGYHVRCQKPLTHTVEEARLLAHLAKKAGVVTQMGNQGTAMDGLRAGAEVIRSGGIGNIKEVHVWTNRPIWPQGMERPKDIEPIPATLRWDLFLGAAPYRPFHKGYQPFDWRGWWDFGTGALGDMACHIMNLAYYSLELGAPESVELVSEEGMTAESGPKNSKLKYRFPANGKRPAVDLYWYEGGAKPAVPVVMGDKQLKEGGSILIGDEGVMYVDDDYGATWHLYPEAKFKTYKPPEPFLPRAPRLMEADGKFQQARNITAEWLGAIRGEVEETSSGFPNYSGPFTETVLLGNVALRTGKTIRWDAESMTAKDFPEATPYIRKSYTRGFSPHVLGT